MYNIETRLIQQYDNTCRSCIHFKTSNVLNGTGSYMGCDIDHHCWNTFVNTQKLCPLYVRALYTECICDEYYRNCINVKNSQGLEILQYN